MVRASWKRMMEGTAAWERSRPEEYRKEEEGSGSVTSPPSPSPVPATPTPGAVAVAAAAPVPVPEATAAEAAPPRERAPRVGFVDGDGDVGGSFIMGEPIVVAAPEADADALVGDATIDAVAAATPVVVQSDAGFYHAHGTAPLLAAAPSAMGDTATATAATATAAAPTATMLLSLPATAATAATVATAAAGSATAAPSAPRPLATITTAGREATSATSAPAATAAAAATASPTAALMGFRRTATGAISGGGQLFSPIVMFYDCFYKRLFELAPDMRALFKNDLRVQGRALVKMVGTAVGLLDQVDTLVPALQSLASRHAGYGVRTPHYTMVGGVLMYTLEHCLGPEEWTPAVAHAWLTVYSVMMAVMIPAARKAEAALPASRRRAPLCSSPDATAAVAPAPEPPPAAAGTSPLAANKLTPPPSLVSSASASAATSPPASPSSGAAARDASRDAARSGRA